MKEPTENKNQTVEYLIEWLKILHDGYTKPDMKSDSPNNLNTTGVIRDTRENIRYIRAANDKLVELLGCDMSGTIEKRSY